MIASVLGFAAGIGWLQQQSVLPGPLLQGSLLAVLVLLALGYRQSRGRPWRHVVLCLLGVAAGVLWSGWQAERRLAEVLPAALEGEDLRISGRIASLPQRTERGWRFEFAVDSLAQLPHLPQLPQRIALSWYEGGGREERDLRVPPLQAGAHWQLTVRLKRPHGNLNPYGFDYERWLFERGIRATGYVRPRAEQRLLAPPSGYFVERARASIRERFEQTLGEAPYVGVLVALAIGDQQSVPLVTCKEVFPQAFV